MYFLDIYKNKKMGAMEGYFIKMFFRISGIVLIWCCLSGPGVSDGVVFAKPKLLENVSILISQGLYGDAIKKLKDTSGKYDENPEYWYLFGKAYYAKGHFGKAAGSFEKAVALGLSGDMLPAAYEKMGWCYYKQGMYASAVATFTNAVSLNPSSASFLTARACALRQKGDYNEALKDFEHALALRPEFVMALDNRAWTYYSMKKYGIALVEFEKAEQLAAEKPSWRSNLLSGQGWCNYMMGNFEKALIKFREASSIAPTIYTYGLWDAYRGMAFSYAALSRYDESYEMIAKAGKVMNYNSDHDLALLYYVADDKKKAWAHLGGEGYVGVGIKGFSINGFSGLFVGTVDSGSPADKAGIRPGDMILAVRGKNICDPVEFGRIIRSLRPGSKLRLEISRSEKKLDLEVIIGAADILLRNDPLLAPIYHRKKPSKGYP